MDNRLWHKGKLLLSWGNDRKYASSSVEVKEKNGVSHEFDKDQKHLARRPRSLCAKIYELIWDRSKMV